MLVCFFIKRCFFVFWVDNGNSNSRKCTPMTKRNPSVFKNRETSVFCFLPWCFPFVTMVNKQNALATAIDTLVLKGGICHFAKWQIPPFNAKVSRGHWILSYRQMVAWSTYMIPTCFSFHVSPFRISPIKYT